jgi:hypothetical protein
MATILTVRLCRCGHAAHPAYGSVCEDCWALAQPVEVHGNSKAVHGQARRLLTPALSGLYYWIVDDGATDPPPSSALAAALHEPPPAVERLPLD